MPYFAFIKEKDIAELITPYATSAREFLHKYSIMREYADFLNELVYDKIINMMSNRSRREAESSLVDARVQGLIDDLERSRLNCVQPLSEDTESLQALEQLIAETKFVEPHLLLHGV